LERLASAVLGPLEGASIGTLRLLASGLELAEGPVRGFGRAVSSLTTDLEHGESAGAFTNLVMRRALRVAALDGGLLVRLEGAEQPFWLGVREALAVLRDDELAALAN
jgi:hypothetical protein